KIKDISVGMQQRVEILKMLYRGADVLILDEPTAVLTPQEINELIDILQSLVKEGKSNIMIKNKLKENMKIRDRCTVKRKGNEILDNIQSMEKEGKAIIMITHKLKEIMKICDRCTVIRKGTGIGTVNVDETTVDELAALMVGRNVTFKTEKTTATPQEIVLEL